MGQVAVVFNPHAKQNAREPERKDRLARILGGAGRVFVTNEIPRLREVCGEIAAGEFDLVCICGGDGTNHLVTSALVPAYAEAGRPLPRLALLKGGSMNTIRWGLGLRSTAEAGLQEILRQRAAGEPFRVIRLGTIHAAGMHGFLFGCGYAVNMLREYYSASSDSGPRRAAEIVYRAIASIVTRGDFFERLAQQFEAEVTLDGRPVGFRSYGMVMASCIEQVGLGFKPLYRAREREGFFHVLASGLSPGQILAQVHRFFVGRRLVGEPHFDEIGTELVIRPAAPLAFTLDGELYEAPEVRIIPGPVLDVVAA